MFIKKKKHIILIHYPRIGDTYLTECVNLYHEIKTTLTFSH